MGYSDAFWDADSVFPYMELIAKLIIQHDIRFAEENPSTE